MPARRWRNTSRRARTHAWLSSSTSTALFRTTADAGSQGRARDSSSAACVKSWAPGRSSHRTWRGTRPRPLCSRSQVATCASCRRSSATPTSTPCRGTRKSSTAASRRHIAATRSSWTARNRPRLSPRSAQLLADIVLELINAAVDRRRQPARNDLLQRWRQELREFRHRLVGPGQVQALVRDGAHLAVDDAHHGGHVGFHPVFHLTLEAWLLVPAGLDVPDLRALEMMLRDDFIEDRREGLRLLLVDDHDQRWRVLAEQQLQRREQRRVDLEPVLGLLR